LQGYGIAVSLLFVFFFKSELQRRDVNIRDN
jgi:hypothetical protein